jgi:hypothetical protein
VAGEWMPLTFFRNNGDQLEDITPATGLPATNGWWNSLVAADFDNDGDTDYIAGNRGLNSRHRASESEPMRIHAADFDQNGSLDPVLSRYIQGRSYPVAPRDLMIDQMIGMKGRFPRFSDYARATLEETLSREEIGRAHVLQSVQFASSYIENLGGGKFTLRPLPLRAQIAPVFGMLTDDFDADGNLDVLLAGNSQAADTQTGWFDASIGAVLLGDGRGGFRYVNGTESGFFVDGNAKGLAQLELDNGRSLILATQNNDSVRVFSPVTGSRSVALQPLDTHAILTFSDGSSRVQELFYGSGYLSQSSRRLMLPANVRNAVIFDSRGDKRAVAESAN